MKQSDGNTVGDNGVAAEAMDTTIPSETLERWSHMAQKLKAKLEATQRENESLKQRLHRKTAECNDLRDEHEFSAEKINDLEFQCLEKSAKIANLTDILDSRGNSNDMQEKLLSKSMEHAELSLSVDRLRLTLQKCESANEHLKKENETLSMVKEELSRKVVELTSVLDRSRKEQERNRKLLIEMGDVVRTLNCVTVEFEATSWDADKTSSSEAGSPQSSLQNIKRKIQAMEQDRQKLMHECESLREENSSKHQRIQDLETQYRCLSASQSHSLSPSETVDSNEKQSSTSYMDRGRGPQDLRQLQTQTSPVSIDTRILEEGAREQEASRDSEESRSEDETRASDDGSTVSDSNPPMVPYDEHETLKKYYEEALDRIIRMSTELSKANRTTQDIQAKERDLQEKDNSIAGLKERLEELRHDLQEKDNYIVELKERLDHMRHERDDVRSENTKLDQDLKEALNLAETATANHVDVIKAHEKQKTEYLALKEKYEKLEKDYSKQLSELEAQVEEAEKFFETQRESLKQKHLEKMQDAAKSREMLQKEHQAAMEAETAKFAEMNEEFDVFMEMHTEMEDELAELKGKYDEALTNIVDLEEQLQATQKESGEIKAKLEKRVEVKEKSLSEVKLSLEKTRKELEETATKEQKLQRDKESILAKHGQVVTKLAEATEKGKRDEATITSLRENCCDMVERLKRAETAGSSQSHKLQASYTMALSKIKYLASHLQTAGILIEELPEEELSRHNSASGHDRIKALERQLMGAATTKKIQTPDPESEPEGFPRDYAILLQKLVESRLPSQNVDKTKKNARQDDPSILFQHISYDKIVHQIKLHQMHNIMMEKLSKRETASDPRSSIESKQSRSNMTSSVGIVDPTFLEHQRRLNVVHFDVVERGSTIDKTVTSEDVVCAGDQNWVSDANGESSDDQDDDADSEVRRLKGESHKIKIAANTAKIRYEAREKERRVMRIQYQKLLAQYNAAVEKQDLKDASDAKVTAIEATGIDEGSSKSSPSAPSLSSSSQGKVKSAVLKIQQNAELQKLQQELNNAELKMERMAIELRATKSKAEVTQRQHEEGEKHLQDAILGQYHSEQLQQRSPARLSPRRPLHHTAVSPIFRGSNAPPLPTLAEQRQEDSDVSQGDDYKSPVSFDGSHLTSLPSLSHGGGGGAGGLEGRGDDVHFEGGIGRYLQLQQEHDKALRTIENLTEDLRDAEQTAEQGRMQLREREEDLRDVIREYNQIKDECDKLFAQIQEKVKEENGSAAGGEEKKEEHDIVSNAGVGSDKSMEDLIRERNVALGKISVLETELEKSQAATKNARKKLLMREDHLRQVIDQYKALKQDHQHTQEQVEELQKQMLIKSQQLQQQHQEYSAIRPTKHLLAPMPPGAAESRQISHESDDKRDMPTLIDQQSGPGYAHDDSRSKSSSKTSQKSKNGNARKPWFRDLGVYSKNKKETGKQKVVQRV